MSTQITKEQADLIEVLNLLEESFKGKETKKINEAKNRLQQILEVSNGLSYGITLLLEALKINSFNNKTISLDIHKSIVIYLKNIFFKNIQFNSEELFAYLINIMNILFMHRNNNPNLSNPVIINIFQNIISIILSSKSIIKKKKSKLSRTNFGKSSKYFKIRNKRKLLINSENWHFVN